MRWSLSVAGMVLAAAMAFAAPANAVVVTYNLTFGDPDGGGPATGGTGVLTADLASIPGTLSVPANASVTLTGTVDGYSFSLSGIGSNAGNFSQLTFLNGAIQNIGTASSGAVATNDSGEHMLISNIGAGGYTLQSYTGNGFNGSGSFSASGPIVAPVPEASTWAMIILGFAAIGLMMTYKRRNRLAPLAA